MAQISLQIIFALAFICGAMSFGTEEKCALKSEFRTGEPLPVVGGSCGRNKKLNHKIDVTVKNHTGEPMVSICFDDTTSEALYTESNIRGGGFEAKVQGRGSCYFHEASNTSYPGMNIDNCCYPKKDQQKTIATLLSSQKLAEKYVDLASLDMYMARGHLTPNSDGSDFAERESTFYYENVVPQWQVINAGNWLDLENAARGYANAHRITLKVYTGTWGVGTLKDEAGKDVEIYLGKASNGTLLKNKLPMPKFMWKILHNSVNNSAVAFVTLNNPYKECHLEADYNFCKDVCETQGWISKFISNMKDPKKGYTQCCSVQELRKLVPFAPNLAKAELLKYTK